MPGRVRAAHNSSTGEVVGSACVVMGVHIAPGGTAGDLVFKDGGSSGTERLRLHISTDSTGDDVTIPGGGMFFETDVHLDNLPNSAQVTVFYK